MRIAEQIDKNGMSSGTAFMDALENLVASEGITRIIETGTYLGTGTTAAILRGIERHGKKPVSFVSIEINPDHYAIACANNRGKPVNIIRGLSIPRDYLPKKKEISFVDHSPDTVVDHPEAVRQNRYYQETNYPGPDRLIDQALVFTSFYPTLVVLDSGGHIGTIEFQYLMTMVKGSFYLALDDTDHVKHAKTVQLIEADNRFSLTFQTKEKFGSRIYSVQMDRDCQPETVPNGSGNNSEPSHD